MMIWGRSLMIMTTAKEYRLLRVPLIVVSEPDCSGANFPKSAEFDPSYTIFVTWDTSQVLNQGPPFANLPYQRG